MSPAAVALLLSDYLSRMTDVIFRHEGTLDRSLGTRSWPSSAPLDMPDHAERSIPCRPEMRERLDEFNSERKEVPPSASASGSTAATRWRGEIGSINKKEYTVLGDTVNTASRLESSVAKPGVIVIGENTYAAVKNRFQLHSLGKATLKGKEKEVAVYEVQGLLASAHAGASTPSGAASREA
jgi:adenylate cyclase